MTWLSDQIAQSIAPTLSELKSSAASAVQSVQQGQQQAASAAASSNAANQAALGAFNKGGINAFNSYLEAIGVSPSQTSGQSNPYSSYRQGGGEILVPVGGGTPKQDPRDMGRFALENGLSLDGKDAAYYGVDMLPSGLRQQNWAPPPSIGTLRDPMVDSDNFSIMQDQVLKGERSPENFAQHLRAMGYSYTGDGMDPTSQIPTAAAFRQGNTQAQSSALLPQSGTAQSILDKFQSSPGYQAMLQAGQQSIASKAAAAGHLGSGAMQKALAKYSADYANTGYQNYLGNLLSGTNVGLQAGQAIGGNATSAGNTLQQASVSAGNAAGSLQKQAGTEAAKVLLGNRVTPGGFGASSFSF